jgi:transposase-like protein
MKRTPQELLQRILEVRAGNLTVTEAARQLGLSRKTYYEKEARALRAMVAALAPEAPGRPAATPPPETVRLRAENNQLRQQLAVLEQRIQIRAWLTQADTRAEKK